MELGLSSITNKTICADKLNTCLHQPVTSPYETVPLVLVLSLAWESVFMGYLQGITLAGYLPCVLPT